MRKTIDELFYLHRAKSGLYSEYELGSVPYIGNGLTDNAVVGLVTPRAEDRVFDFAAVVVSAFCEATVQLPPFVACGRAGNGLVVLETKLPMSWRKLAAVATYINLAVRWRFNWYRQVTADRLRAIEVSDDVPPNSNFHIDAALPPRQSSQRPAWQSQMKHFVLGDLFDIRPGVIHSVSELSKGSTPVVSCGDLNNGVMGYFDVDAFRHKNRITVAFNGDTLTSKFHPYEFVAKDDVGVCVPKKSMRLTTQIFVQMMLNRERWRYSYYRKCYSDKAKRVEILLPAKGDEVDEDTIASMVATSPYWGYLEAAAAT